MSENPTPTRIEIFEQARPRLLSVAYRILGSRAEAEDAVQDTFLRWQGADIATVRSPGAWLTAACTRRAIDMLRAAYRSRVDYVVRGAVHLLPYGVARSALDDTTLRCPACSGP